MPEVINKAFLQALVEMDEADIARIEQGFEPIEVNQVRERIESVNGQFFSVDFARKNDKKEKGKVIEAKGTIRHMVCRRGVAKYVKGVQPEGQRRAEDNKHEVLTVWDVGRYQEYRKSGIEQEVAGEQAYRRINMSDVRAISIPAVIRVEQERAVVENEAVREPADA